MSIIFSSAKDSKLNDIAKNYKIDELGIESWIEWYTLSIDEKERRLDIAKKNMEGSNIGDDGNWSPTIRHFQDW